MNLAFSSEDHNLAIAAFIQDQILQPETFNCHIHAEDEMLLFLLKAFSGDRDRALLSYLKSGQEVMTRVRQIIQWRFQGFDQVSSFLDFACGYGRFTRFLVQELAPEKIWVSDIYQQAVLFQQQEFKVNGFFSVANPEELDCNQQFDVILVASLLSHLPEVTFKLWLQKLISLLTPKGLLIFSVHDEKIIPNGQTMPANGLLFIPESESQSLSPQQYGSTWVNEQFVRNAIASASSEELSYHRLPKSLWQQDFYLVVKEAQQDFSKLHLKLGPKGDLGQVELFENRRLFLRGWAVDLNSDERIQEVQVYFNNQLKQRCIPYELRPTIAEYFQDELYLKSGWSCWLTLPLKIYPDQDILLIKAISNNQLERVIYVGRLRDAVANLESIQLVKSPINRESKLRLGNLFSSFFKKDAIAGHLDMVSGKKYPELLLTGWAISLRRDSKIVDIQIWIDNQFVQRCIPFIDRPDIAEKFGDELGLESGWFCSCEVPKDADLATMNLQVKVLDAQGEEKLLYTGTLAKALRQI